MRPKPPRRGRPSGGARNLAAAERVARPVSALADSFVAGAVIPEHFHQRAQLVFALQGTMAVQAAGSVWMLPPSHALWIPPGIAHRITMKGAVEMRTLYVQPRHAAAMGKNCRVLFVSPLLRELIVRAMEIPVLYDRRGMDGRVMKLILDETARLPAQPLSLRMPRDSRLLRLCERVLGDLSSRAPLARHGAAVGLSERSVMRLFLSETGMTFKRWQNQARLLRAFELFEQGKSVTHVAMDVGYSSAAAFTKMFRQSLGRTPSVMRDGR
jgi:AraC-like DNA-binding protein